MKPKRVHNGVVPTATAPRTVPATCPCGASFGREVKQGRPQVWCPACRKPKPSTSTKRSKVEAVAEPVVVKVAPVTTPAVAPALEADVRVVYSDHLARYEARVAAGVFYLDAASATSAETRERLVSVYARYPKPKSKKQAWEEGE